MKIILIFGPSGSGKSTTANWLAKDLNLLHFEADQSPLADGIDSNKLRIEWDRFYLNNDPEPLLKSLKDRAKKEKKKGAILSLPSFIVNSKLLTKSSQIGLSPIILYGSGAQCLDSFLNRSRKEDPLCSIENKTQHWIQNNKDSYIEMSKPEYNKFRISTFNDYSRKSNDDIKEEILKMI